MKLTLYFDATCPLCKKEMEALTRYDKHKALTLVNIYQPDFQKNYPHIDAKKANDILHAEDHDGHIYLGLDATQAAWNCVGKKKWINVLRKPLIRPLADWCYLRFAQHRYTFSWLLTGKKRIECKQCR